MADPGSDVPAIFRDIDAGRRIALIASSYAALLGRPLVSPCEDPVAAMWAEPRVILAHGTEDDPVFFFANRRALTVFGYDLATFLRTPSRLSAEAPLRAERQALFDRVGCEGYIENYAGVRITASGKRFRIEQAIVWDIRDPAGERHGQAATFVA